MDYGRHSNLLRPREPMLFEAKTPERPIVLRAAKRALDAGEPNDTAPVWEQVALEGDYKGHGAGPFKLDAKVFAQIIANFRSHPSYRAAEQRTAWVANGDNSNTGRVIPWDFHHANEAPPAAVASQGAPAQGWVLELGTREGPLGLELWALTDWLPQARTYIRQGSYQWSSVAIWPDVNDAKTGKSMGCYLSSIALTNDPFIQGMQPLQATRQTRDRRTLDVVRGPSLDDVRSLVREALKLKYPPQGPDDCGDLWICDVYDATVIFEWQGKFWEIAYVIDGTTVTLGPQSIEVARSYVPVAPNPATPATPAAALSRQPKESSTMNEHLKLLLRLSQILGVKQNALLLDASATPEAQIAALTPAVVTAADDKMAQLATLLAQASQMCSAMMAGGDTPPAPPGADPKPMPPAGIVAARIAELVTTEAAHKKNAPILAAYEKAQKEHAEAAIVGDVDDVAMAYGYTDDVKPALLALRRSSPEEFTKRYPVEVETQNLPQGYEHITQSLVTTPSQPALMRRGAPSSRMFSNPRGPAVEQRLLGGGGQPAGNGANAGGDIAQQVKLSPGVNALDKTRNYLLSRIPAGQPKPSYDEAHIQACELLGELRAAGAQL